MTNDSVQMNRLKLCDISDGEFSHGCAGALDGGPISEVIDPA